MIKKYQPTKLFLAVDAPRSSEETSLVQDCKSLTELIDWECDVFTKFPNKNLGCRLAVSQAITWFFENIEHGIILEDDCLPSIDFFYFCEKCHQIDILLSK